MSQRCKTCAHPAVTAINAKLVGNVAYSQIAAEFELSSKTVERHAKNHIAPLVQAANEAVTHAVITQAREYRDEIHYEIKEKVKLLQARILNDMDGATQEQRTSLYREFRGAVQEEAKLTGSYQKDGANENDMQRVIQAYKSFLKTFPDASETQREQYLSWFAQESGVDAVELSRQVQVVERVQ